uniref:Uncharacterized protein n=1 Tax=Anguilla anguilla TaxID=7936 RepID=A0A0E9SRU9_ANGAN
MIEMTSHVKVRVFPSMFDLNCFPPTPRCFMIKIYHMYNYTLI